MTSSFSIRSAAGWSATPAPSCIPGTAARTGKNKPRAAGRARTGAVCRCRQRLDRRLRAWPGAAHPRWRPALAPGGRRAGGAACAAVAARSPDPSRQRQAGRADQPTDFGRQQRRWHDLARDRHQRHPGHAE